MQNDLLKVMIVDDERLVRDLLKACIDWEEIGLTVIGESSSAIEGIDLVDKLLPDIIFTDICMSIMDGLEFSRIVAEKHPQIKIIILTGHEEFEYAKKGIKVGIADLLLKPINDDEIRRTALKIKDKIIKERTQIEEYDRLKESLHQNMPFLREKLLNELILNGVDLSKMEEKISYFNIKIKDNFFQIAVIEANSSREEDCFNEENKLLLRIRILELTQQYFINDEYIHAFLDNSQRVIILCNEDSIDIWECCEDLKAMLINRLKCFIYIGIGNKHYKMDKIAMSYKEACDALKYRFVLGKNQIISFSDICDSRNNEAVIDLNLMESFCFYLKSGLKDKAEEVVTLKFDEVKSTIMSREEVRVFACNFISNILNVLIETGIKQEDIFEDNIQPFETIFKRDTLPDMEEYIRDIIKKVIYSINYIKGKKVKKIIKDVKKYIDNNYSNPELTLSDVAKNFFVNLSYLSRTFKEETGLTFVDYINKLRMEKAIKLLNENDKKAYQIAEEVGINDPHYFSVCFKKFTGMCFNEFKKAK